eukprot:TRINITY_DN6680_c0_g1_i1.p1 TRINITY_DN6680_c0_g1~~TRINITY_DN6680_c0_g1_i1.p1  ORF type:complete len:919 (-),score=162.20 TRINITY_DN6680_c0_g1_i1:482-3238(-)
MADDLGMMVQNILGIPTKCGQCACSEENELTSAVIDASSVVDMERGLQAERQTAPPKPHHERGLIAYTADIHHPLAGPPLRTGEVWHLPQDDVTSFQRAVLSLHANGLSIRPLSGRSPVCIAWSPFSLVQACRLHTEAADAARPWMRLFKVSVFHHGVTHLFAAEGQTADSERARWVADIACGVRVLTQSLFPPFRLSVFPVQGAVWTATRLLAGYMLMCDSHGVSLVYCELHSHWDTVAAFVAYEDEYCDARVLHIPMGVHTSISERVGVDCSCFIIDAHHFSTRTCAEKALWLRAISNVKVKLRHSATNPSSSELMSYRHAINDSVKDVPSISEGFTQKALLPLRVKQRPFDAPVGDTPPRKVSEEQQCVLARVSATFAFSAPPAPPMTQSEPSGLASAQPSAPPSLSTPTSIGNMTGIPKSARQSQLAMSMGALGPVLTPPQLPMLLRETSRETGNVASPSPSDLGVCEALLSESTGFIGPVGSFRGTPISITVPEEAEATAEMPSVRMAPGINLAEELMIAGDPATRPVCTALTLSTPSVGVGLSSPHGLAGRGPNPIGDGGVPQGTGPHRTVATTMTRGPVVSNPSVPVLSENAGGAVAILQMTDVPPIVLPPPTPPRNVNGLTVSMISRGRQMREVPNSALPEPSPEPAPSTGVAGGTVSATNACFNQSSSGSEMEIEVPATLCTTPTLESNRAPQLETASDFSEAQQNDGVVLSGSLLDLPKEPSRVATENGASAVDSTASASVIDESTLLTAAPSCPVLLEEVDIGQHTFHASVHGGTTCEEEEEEEEEEEQHQEEDFCADGADWVLSDGNQLSCPSEQLETKTLTKVELPELVPLTPAIAQSESPELERLPPVIPQSFVELKADSQKMALANLVESASESLPSRVSDGSIRKRTTSGIVLRSCAWCSRS